MLLYTAVKGFSEWLISESSQMAKVYHVSPESHLGKLRPTGFHKGVQSSPQRQEGVYVAPKFRDAVAWAASFVIHQKDKAQEKKRSDREYKTDQYGMHKEPMKYKNVTIYELQVPKELLQKSWYNNSWEPEYFITDVDAITIVSSQTYTKDEIFKLYRVQTAQRQDHHHKEPEKVAGELRGNYAAKEWLRLKEIMRSKALKGWQPVDKDGIQRLMNKLQSFFVSYIWNKSYTTPAEQVSAADLPKVKQIVAELEQLLA